MTICFHENLSLRGEKICCGKSIICNCSIFVSYILLSSLLISTRIEGSYIELEMNSSHKCQVPHF